MELPSALRLPVEPRFANATELSVNDAGELLDWVDYLAIVAELQSRLSWRQAIQLWIATPDVKSHFAYLAASAVATTALAGLFAYLTSLPVPVVTTQPVMALPVAVGFAGIFTSILTFCLAGSLVGGIIGAKESIADDLARLLIKNRIARLPRPLQEALSECEETCELVRSEAGRLTRPEQPARGSLLSQALQQAGNASDPGVAV